MNPDLQALALAHGNDQEWHQMLQMYGPLLRFHAYSVVKNNHDADEVVQDTLCRLWDKRESLATIEKLKHFLVRCVRNSGKNFLRGKSRAPRCVGDASAFAAIAAPQAENPLVLLAAKDLYHQMSGLLNKLTIPQQRVMEVVREDPDLSSRAVGLRVGCSHKNVLMILGRVRVAASLLA